MTPEERAEKIIGRQAAEHLSWNQMSDFIAAQIREAVEEEERKRMDWDVAFEALEAKLKTAKAEALEEAAKIAELTISVADQRVCGHIAKKIRALIQK